MEERAAFVPTQLTAFFVQLLAPPTISIGIAQAAFLAESRKDSLTTLGYIRLPRRDRVQDLGGMIMHVNEVQASTRAGSTNTTERKE